MKRFTVAGISLGKLLHPGALVLVCASLLGACGSKTTLGTKSLSESLPSATIPGFPGQFPLSGEIPVPLTAEAQSAADDTEYVTWAKLRSLTFSILEASENDANEDGAMDDFDFLFGMEIYLVAVIGGEENKLLVASLPEGDPQIGSGLRTLSLSVENVDVLDHIEAPLGYELRVQGTGVVPPDDVVFTGEIRYRVGVGLRR